MYLKGVRTLDSVIKSEEKQIKCKIRKCGTFIAPDFPTFGTSPECITEDHVIEVKCPSEEKYIRNYVMNKIVVANLKVQLHLQMLCAVKKEGLFCGASPDFESSRNVEIYNIKYDKGFLNALIAKAQKNYKNFVYLKLLNTVQ